MSTCTCTCPDCPTGAAARAAEVARVIADHRMLALVSRRRPAPPGRLPYPLRCVLSIDGQLIVGSMRGITNWRVVTRRFLEQTSYAPGWRPFAGGPAWIDVLGEILVRAAAARAPGGWFVELATAE